MKNSASQARADHGSDHGNPERLPFRLDGGSARALAISAGEVEVCQLDSEEMPTLRCVLSRPAAEKVSLTLRVHSRAGIPLASTSIDLNPGDEAFETPRLSVLAMEGYSHVDHAERLAIERRVWSRRAFVSARVTGNPGSRTA